MVKISLLLLGLLGEDVAVVSVMSLDLTRSGQRESLLGAGICLNFWHFLVSLIRLLKYCGSVKPVRYALLSSFLPYYYFTRPR